MRKPQKALPIFPALFLYIISLQAQKVGDDEFEGFEDNLLVLTKLSEQITLDQLSLKSFRSQERVAIAQRNPKTGETQQQDSTHTFTVSRKPDQRVNEKLIFSESRAPAISVVLPQIPLLDQPFTGKWLETLSFENRLANDFRKLPAEQIEGRDCLVFAFETAPQISFAKIMLLGKAVPLNQRGRIWIDAKSFQIVRLVAKQIKLPKGCRSYDYQIDFCVQTLFGRSMSLPARVESKLSLKDLTLEVLQEYSNFEVI